VICGVRLQVNFEITHSLIHPFPVGPVGVYTLPTPGARLTCPSTTSVQYIAKHHRRK
jgi:hypothetical protein